MCFESTFFSRVVFLKPIIKIALIGCWLYALPEVQSVIVTPLSTFFYIFLKKEYEDMFVLKFSEVWKQN